MYHNNTYMKHSSDLEFQVASRSINFEIPLSRIYDITKNDTLLWIICSKCSCCNQRKIVSKLGGKSYTFKHIFNCNLVLFKCFPGNIISHC